MITPDLLVVCPHCGRINERHDGPSPADLPKTGDVSVCWRCRSIAIYEAPDLLRKPTPDELTDLLASPDVRSVLGLIAESFTPADVSSLRGIS